MEFQASVEFQTAASFALDRTTETVSVYTRHGADCPKSSEPYWRRCRCLKYLYIYQNGTSRQISARTRSWEKAEQKAHEIRASIDPTNRLRRQLEAKIQGHDSQVEISAAAEEFLREVSRLNRAEATRKKYKLTLDRMATWCRTQPAAVFSLSQLDVPTLRRWIHSWSGSPTTRHNQHQRIIAFFNFCIEQGWIKENPAKRIKKVPRQQDETLPFSREQYDALIEATYYYDGRGQERNGETSNSRRVRAYLKLLRWSGLRAGDAACLAKSKLRDDDSLVLYQAKVKHKASAPVCVLLPHEIAEELRDVPPSTFTHPDHFFWSGRSKRKSEVSIGSKSLPKSCQRPPNSSPSCSLKVTESRTVRVRFAFSNPGLALKPGMFVNVSINVPLGRQLVIPASGALQAGTREIAFIDHGNGYLEPREIQIGPHLDDHVVVLKGLKAGERIVSSANFLLDSEAQLQAAIGSFAPPPPGAGAAASMNAPVQEAAVDFTSNPSPPHKGSDALRVKLRSSDGKPIAGAEVSVAFYMAAMPAMGMAAVRQQAAFARD